MAIVKFGGGVSGIRGNLGGNVFSVNTNGAYARPWANQVNQRTWPQTVQRFYWSYILPAWSEIEVENKLLWKDYAATHVQTNPLGELYYMTSLQWFTRCNLRLLTWGGSPVGLPPVNPIPATRVPNALVYEPGGSLPYIAVTYDENLWTGAFMVLDAMVLPHGQALSWQSKYYRMAAGWEPYGTELSFMLQHNYKFGLPQTGWQCLVRVYTGSDEGLQSPAWEAREVYPAP
jgi:hypothetical protein